MGSNTRVGGKVTRIGTSLGIVIPNDEVKRHGLKEGDAVELDVEKRVNLQELFGSAMFSKGAQNLKDEARRGWGDL
jgi:antitoxin component of MazEF toxin-antitoxin module